MSSTSTDKVDTMLMAVVNQFVEDMVSAKDSDTTTPLERMDTRIEVLQLAMSALERTHKTVETRTFQLGRERNALPPIQKLPIELMTTIFKSVLCGLVEEDDAKEYINWRCSLLLVCSRWRMIFQEDPALWSYISAAFPPPIVTQSLYLSRDHSLLIVIPFNSFEPKRCVVEMTQHARRWNTADICLSDREGYEENFPIPSAPMLEALLVEARGRWNRDYPVPISVNILPQLRDLSIQGLPHVVLDPTILPSLRTLILNEIDVTKMPVTTMLDFLAQMPGLEEFAMETKQPVGPRSLGIHADIDVEPPQSFRPVAMPHLQEFSLDSLPPLYAQIMISSITFGVNMSFEVCYSQRGTFPNLKYFVVRQIHNWLTACRRNISCRVREYISDNLMEVSAKIKGDVIVHVSISVNEVQHIEDVLHTAREFLGMASAPAVVVLHLQDGRNLSMVRTLLRYPTVFEKAYKVVLSFEHPWQAPASEDVSTFLKELGLPFINGTECTESNWLLPNLEDLEIVSDVPPETYTTELIAMLKSRCAAGGDAEEGSQKPRLLKRLHIKGIGITTADEVEEILGSGILTKMN